MTAFVATQHNEFNTPSIKHDEFRYAPMSLDEITYLPMQLKNDDFSFLKMKTGGLGYDSLPAYVQEQECPPTACVPLPRFVLAQSTPDKETDDKGQAQRARLKVATLAKKRSRDLQKLLEDAACRLMLHAGRTCTLAYLGRELSASSKRWLRFCRLRLGQVLSCYALDFKIFPCSTGASVKYMHSAVLAEHSYYESDDALLVNINL